MRIIRSIEDFGLWPKTTLLFSFILFCGFCWFLPFKTSYAGYILALIGISLLIPLSNRGRDRFFNIQLQKADKYRVRIMENVVCIIPFILALIYYEEYVLALIVVTLSLLLTLPSITLISLKRIPTPFYFTPFENIVGFRSTFLFIPISYFILFKGIQVDNFFLGLFSLAILFFVLLQYYGRLEEQSLIRVYRKPPNQFLLQKSWFAGIAIVFLCCIPISSLCYFFPDRVLLVLGSGFLLYAYILCFLWAKYAAYPKNMTLAFSIIIVASFLFPPALLFLLPFFYRKSINRLRPYL